MSSLIMLRGRALLAAVAIVSLSGCGPTGSEENVEFDDAVAASLAEGRIVIATFTADWCGPCKRMAATTWTDPALNAWIDDHAVRILVDIDVHRQFSIVRDITSIPTSVAYLGDRELGRVVGMRDAEAMIDWLERLRSEVAPLSGTQDESVGG